MNRVTNIECSEQQCCYSVTLGEGLNDINPLRLNSGLSQTSHCNIKALSVSEVTRI